MTTNTALFSTDLMTRRNNFIKKFQIKNKISGLDPLTLQILAEREFDCSAGTSEDGESTLQADWILVLDNFSQGTIVHKNPICFKGEAFENKKIRCDNHLNFRYERSEKEIKRGQPSPAELTGMAVMARIDIRILGYKDTLPKHTGIQIYVGQELEAEHRYRLLISEIASCPTPLPKDGVKLNLRFQNQPEKNP